MFADNDNDYPSDYFMPKPDPWRWVWFVLIFSDPLMLLVALVGFIQECTKGQLRKLV